MKFIIKNLNFKFSSKESGFFKNLSITLDSGHAYIITGANGTGKSTFFRVLKNNLAAYEFASGELTFNSKLLLSDEIAMVQQNYNNMLALEFSGDENLRLAALPEYPNYSGLPGYILPRHLAHNFKVPLDIPVSQLSGGQRQLLAILMMLQKPIKVLLLDEPTAALDPINSEIVIEFLQYLAHEQNIVIMFICHDPQIMSKYSREYTLVVEKQDDTSIISFKS